MYTSVSCCVLEERRFVGTSAMIGSGTIRPIDIQVHALQGDLRSRTTISYEQKHPRLHSYASDSAYGSHTVHFTISTPQYLNYPTMQCLTGRSVHRCVSGTPGSCSLRFARPSVWLWVLGLRV